MPDHAEVETAVGNIRFGRADAGRAVAADGADESYLILSSREREGYGSGDLFVAFRTADGGWSEPKNMGPRFNSPLLDFCPMFSPDGRWFSFSRRYGDTWATTTDAEIYWFNAKALEEFRPE